MSTPRRAVLFVFGFLSIYSLFSYGVHPSLASDVFLNTSKENSLPPEEDPNSESYLSKSNITFGFLTHPFESRSILLVNGTADDSFVLSFRLEPGKQAINYTLVFLSNDTNSLDPKTDISFSQTEFAGAINSTIALDFHRFPGRVQLTVEIRYASDATLYDVFQVDYLVAGIVIYLKRTLTIISGAGRSFIIPNYQDIYANPHWEFSVFVQYPNGSNSNTWPTTTGEMFVPSIGFDSIIPEIMFQYGQIRWDDSLCAIDGGKWAGNQLVLKSGCGMGFGNAFINDTNFDGCRFALYFQPHRVGKLGILFTWSGFTLGSDLEDEELTNYIIIEILGQPPSIVRRIEPANPFDKNGGEELYVETINTADVNMTSFNVNAESFSFIEGSRNIIDGPEDFYESAKFLTKPGTGKRLPWSITATRTVNGTESEVNFIDETRFLFSYDDESVTLLTMIPSSVSEDGEAAITLNGDFPSFNITNPAHNVYCGNLLVDRLRYLFFNDSLIKFNIPKRADLGASWKYVIYVQIGDSFSNELTFKYTPTSLLLRGMVFGASFNADQGVYVLNNCGNSTFMVTVRDQQQETENATYEWKLLDRSNFNYLELENATSIVNDSASLELPNEYIPRFGETFYIVANLFGQNAVGTYMFSVRKSNEFVIGVTLIQPENRTISTPVVNVRIIAKIEFPECADTPTELIYEWELENKSQTIATASRLGLTPLSVHESSLPPSYDKYVFSFQNDTGTQDNEITPTRLGRELIVPRELIEQGLHRVRLTVRDNIAPLKGFDSTNFTILESSLVARIGTGQVSRRISDAEPLVMTSEQSYDPDVITSSNRSIGLSFSWSCDFSLFSNFSNSNPCGNALLPPEFTNTSRFEVPKDTLKVFSNLTIEGGRGSVYLRYSVTVMKQARKTSAMQTLSLTKSMGEMVSRYQRIEIVNSRNEAVKLDAVEFWDEVVIRPIASTSTEWRFRLQMPASERARFLSTSGNLIASAGYYTVSGQNSPGFQQLPLGIKADRLRPRQTYQFLITFQEVGRLADDVTVQLETLDVPELSFPSLTISNGSTATIFRATASTSFQGQAKFTYQFYLYDTAKNSSEYCIDGCTGAHTVRFQIPNAGIYVLQCRLLAASGKTLLSVKNNTKTITVFSSSTSYNLTKYDTSIARDFKLGDDGWVTQNGFFAAESIHEHEKSKGMLETRSSSPCISFTQKWVQILRHIVTNELPNTPNARNYVGLAANYARLDCVGYEDILYDLLTVVDQSITKTPQEEVLTTSSYLQSANFPNVEMHEDLRRFYNFSITKASQIIMQGSTRYRLMPQPGEVNNLIIDLAELSMKHLTATATSGRVCGWEGKYTFGTWDGVPGQSTTSSDLGSPLGVTSVHVAVKCNSEQGRSLKTPHASFEWCDAVFAVSGDDRKLIVLAETFDFPHISGVQGQNSSETVRVVMVDITTLGKNNQLESTVSTEDVLKAQTSSTRANANSCYRVGMQMSQSTAARRMNCWLNQPFLMSPRKPFEWKISRPFEQNMYLQRTTGLSTTAETRNSTINVTAQSNELGLYGAHRAACSAFSPENLAPSDGTGVLLAGFLIGILLLIIIITALTYLLVSALVGAAASDDDDDMAATAQYIERDYFGRKEVRLDMGSYTSSTPSSMFFGGSQRSLMLSGALPMAARNNYGSDRMIVNNVQRADGENMLGSEQATRL